MRADERSLTAGPMVPKPYRVESRTVELDDTVTLELKPVDEALPRPAAGQFNMMWAFGVGEAPISVAGWADDQSVTHTIRDVGAVTAALCGAGVGDELGLRGPYGSAWGVERARGRDVLVVAGGLGLAPVRPIVLEVLSHRADYGQATVLVGARSPDLLLYGAELEDWMARDDLDVQVTVDAADPSWRGDVGMVTTLIDRFSVGDAPISAFVCGPEVMMRFSAAAVVGRGVPPEHVRLSMERNMHCAIGHCGHCQLGPLFICKDGPVIDWPTIEPLMREFER